MKRLTSCVLSLLLAFGVLLTPALAAGEDYTFTLTANEQAEASAMVGDTITVTLRVKNNHADEIQLYGMQDYINFDPEYLEFIPGSEKFYEQDGYALISGSVLPGGRQVFTNRAGMSPLVMKNGTLLMQFDLKALKAGTAAIESSGAEMIDQNVKTYPVALENARVTIRAPHTHTMQHVAEQPATEQASGVREHWKCSGCGKCFLDEQGTKEASETELLIPKKQHVHKLVHNPGKPATESLLGLKEHWKCSGCGKLFLDAQGTKEVSQDDLLIPKKEHHHTMKAIPEQPATVNATGLKAHFRCTGCGRLFLDEAGTKEVTKEDLILPKKENKPVGPVGPVVPEPVVPQPEEPVGFADVPADAYYCDAVRWAVQQNITTGTSKTTFSPDMICDRAQMVTFLWRAAGSPEPASAAVGFKDVAKGSYYEKAVAWAVEQNITTGTSKTTFSPAMVCSRAQTVTFLWRANGSKTAAASSFSDVAANAYYAGAVSWAVENNITKGTGGGNFSPDMDCSRGQIVTFLYRAETAK